MTMSLQGAKASQLSRVARLAYEIKPNFGVCQGNNPCPKPRNHPNPP